VSCPSYLRTKYFKHCENISTDDNGVLLKKSSLLWRCWWLAVRMGICH